MLSRLPVEATELIDEDFFDFDTTAFESDEYLELLKNVLENQQQLPELRVENGKIYKKVAFDSFKDVGESIWKLWIPHEITHLLIEKGHKSITSAHGGTRKTLEKLRKLFYWPKMTVQVENYNRNCQICMESKPTNQHTMPTIGCEVESDRPFQKIYVDFLGKYPRSKKGNAYIFIVLEHFSKFVFLKAMREATAKNVVQFLVQEVFQKFGVPEVLHSDNGPQFVSTLFNEMIQTNKITHMKTAFYAPQSNAAERVNQSVLTAIRAYLQDDHRD